MAMALARWSGLPIQWMRKDISGCLCIKCFLYWGTLNWLGIYFSRMELHAILLMYPWITLRLNVTTYCSGHHKALTSLQLKMCGMISRERSMLSMARGVRNLQLMKSGGKLKKFGITTQGKKCYTSFILCQEDWQLAKRIKDGVPSIESYS